MLLVLASLLPPLWASGQDEAWPDVFNPFRVRTLFIELDAATWDAIKHDQNYSNCNTPGCDPALNLRAQCLMWDDVNTNRMLVQIRRKSDPALPDESNPQKVSLKIDVNEYVTGQEWRGLKKISLENGAGGNGVLREGLSMQLYRIAGEQGFYNYQPGYSAWVRLVVNGSYVGLYSSPEQRDKTFLKQRGMYKPGASWLYEINGGITLDTTVAVTNSPTDEHLCYPPFKTTCPQPNLEADLPLWVDMQTMLTMAAMEAFCANKDGLFTHNGKNSFAVDFLPSTQLKRLYFPWDLDATVTSETFDIYNGGPGNPSSHVYQRQILDHYWFRQVYRHTMTDLLNGPLSTGVVTDFMNRLEPVLTPYLAEDPNAGDTFEEVRTYITNRVANVRAQVGAVTGWPLFSQPGGAITPGFQLTLTLTNAVGAIYYTVDGTDPRGLGGLTNGLTYSAPVTLTNTTHVAARVKSGTNWSTLRQATFNVPDHASAIKITEIMYHPRSPFTNDDGGDYEFIELKNIGATPVNLSRCYFAGIDFTFTPGTTVAPGSFVVLVRNPVAFASRYGSVAFQGVYFGGLSAAGEKLRLRNSDGTNIFSVEYDNKPSWPLGADGLGYSLVNMNPAGDPDDPRNWRESTNVNGSPGEEDPAPPYTVGVVVNEVLAHTDTPLEDAIELYNTTTNAIDISGWFLSDQNDTADPARLLIKKHRFPAGTVIAAGGYKTLYEEDFNPASVNSTALIKFALSQYGEGAYLASANGTGELTGHIVGMEFGASDNGWSFGRFLTSAGVDSTFLAQHTFGVTNPASKKEFRLGTGMTNSSPRVGPVVFSELMYHPASGGNEFLELQNLTGTNLDLGGWSLIGAGGFVFPSSCTIPANGLLLLLGTTNVSAEQFRAASDVPLSVPILSHAFELENSGEELQLCKPNDDPGAPPILVDRVRYNDKGLWPTAADGGGPSLERFPASAYGNEPLSWYVLKPGGSPGRAPGLSRLKVSMELSGLLLQWDSFSGGKYRVQRADDLDHWADLGSTITASGPTTQYFDAEALASTRYFYRIAFVKH